MQNENQVDFCPTATPQQLDYLNQFNGICIIPNTALTQTECSNEPCFNALNNDYKWYNPATQKFTCQECAAIGLKKCFYSKDCHVCFNRMNEFALLPCGHGHSLI